MSRRRNGLIAGCSAALAMSVVLAPAPAGAVNADLDPTFSGDGRVLVAARQSSATSVVVSGGLVYAAGDVEVAGERPKVFVTRVTDDGEWDADFGIDGTRLIGGDGENYTHTGMTVDSRGRVLVAAQSRTSTLVVRLTPEGDLDESFSGDGRRLLPGGVKPLYFDPDVVVDGAARIVVAAMVDLGRGRADVRIWRLTRAGARDDSWSDDGLRTIDVAAEDWMDGIAVDARDRVIAATDHTDSPALVYRYRQNGALDPSFSDDGLAQFRLSPRVWTFPMRIGVGADGRITVAASGVNANLYGAARLNDAGELVASYGDGGVLSVGCRVECLPTWADVDEGRVAVVTRPYGFDGPLGLTRIGTDGIRIDQYSVDDFPADDGTIAYAVEIDGARTLFAGTLNRRAYVARLP